MIFGNPAALWLLSAIAPLAALYFLKVRRQRVVVPSLLLWASVVRNQREARPFDRFRRHLLFLLQLLALLLLIFALSAPSIPGRRFLGRSVVFVLDGSASMGAKAPAPSRWDEARRYVLSGIAGLQSGDEAMVLFAGPEPRVAASFSRDHERLAATVRALEPTSAAASLAGAVDLAVALTRSRPDRSIVVVTDGSDPSLDAALARHREVRAELVGRPASNVAITALDLRRSPTSDLDSEVFVTLRRFGGVAGPVGVEVSLDGVLVTSETVELPADGPTARVYRGFGEKGGLVRIHVETGDALEADDDAVAWLAPAQQRRVLCVGCTGLTARALAVDPRFQLTIAAAAPPESESWDALVFEGIDVPERPTAPFLALGPARLGAEAMPAALPWPRVTSWRKAHPTLRFVEPAALTIAEARAGVLKGWEPLLESDAGPLLSTGLHGGQRGLVLHFLPSRSDLPLRVAWPIFLLNGIGWLTGEEAQGTQRTVAAGAALLREGWGDDGATVTLTRPDGSTLPAIVRDGVVRFGGLEQVGVYKLDGPGGRTERLAANLVSEAESNLDVVPLAPPPADAAGLRASVAGRLPLLRPALGLLGLLLVLEWWVYQRRYRDA